MKLPCLLQPRILKEAIRALFKGPYTTKFPYSPHKPAETFRGKPEFFEKECVGCTACVQVCPTGALSFKDENGKRQLVLRLDICIFCGQCQANCLTGRGIRLTQEFDLATTGNRQDLKQEIEKELVLCEKCGKIIAPRDQILWVAKRLGPLLFSNASLILFYLRDLNLSLSTKSGSTSGGKEELLPKKEEFLRSDRIKILCPKCRREAVVKS